jgi:hypothetical protein
MSSGGSANGAAGASGSGNSSSGGVSSGSGGVSGSSGISGLSGSGGTPAVCTQGDTRTCTGPGACAGGQICGSDEMWGSCDCGGSGGSGGAPTTPLNPGDEPCPPDPIPNDCSQQCTPQTPSACSIGCPGTAETIELTAGKVIARMPSNPGSNNCKCFDDIALATLRYGVTFTSSVSTADEFHVQVPKGWAIGGGVGNITSCLYSAQGYSCLGLGAGEKVAFTIFSDPDLSTAPAFNVTLEAGPCP